MKKLLAFVAVCFAFSAGSAIAKNDYSCDKKFIFFQAGQKVDHLELLFTTVSAAAAEHTRL